jgi:hypothetical protein
MEMCKYLKKTLPIFDLANSFTDVEILSWGIISSPGYRGTCREVCELQITTLGQEFQTHPNRQRRSSSQDEHERFLGVFVLCKKEKGSR